MATEILPGHLDANAMAEERTDWATSRTRLAAERTLMAAVRTSLSLISFGFTIYKFFESLRATTGAEGLLRVKSPRRLGMTLISLGVFVLVAAAWQHWFFLQELQKQTDRKFPRSVSLTVSVLLALTGIVLFVTILMRL